MSLTPANPASSLPPVQPPSGRFIAQLFLVPGLIVLVVVLMVLGINYLLVGGNTPQHFLVLLDSDNRDIRWRGANDLAQILKRKESVHLKTDVTLVLGLVERLQQGLETLAQDEKSVGDKLPKGQKDLTGKAFLKLEPQRNYINFLTAALGDFQLPAGVPILTEMILTEDGPDPLQTTMRRRQALWALANLGENRKAFQTQLKLEQQNLILSALRSEAESTDKIRRRAAKNALFYLNQWKDANDPEIVSVDLVLAKAAGSEDQFLRSQLGLAIYFWDGPSAEATLLKLSKDNGFGTELRTPVEP